MPMASANRISAHHHGITVRDYRASLVAIKPEQDPAIRDPNHMAQREGLGMSSWPRIAPAHCLPKSQGVRYPPTDPVNLLSPSRTYTVGTVLTQERFKRARRT